ncbi:hypothetical protein L211DRAFT_797200, partial [Terfezia boudieri ATCC MYA-4762]
NYCEPSLEFPLPSPYSGILHHLSNPNSYTTTQIYPRTLGSVDDVRLLSLYFKMSHLQPLCQHPC